MTLHRLLTSDDRSWALFPQVLRRCAAFIETYQSETHAAVLDANLRAKFVTGDQALGVWVALVDDTIVAHMVAFIEETPFGRRAFVVQLEADVAMVPEFHREGMAAVEEWARTCGANRIEMWTTLPERFFSRLGFEPFRTIMRRTL